MSLGWRHAGGGSGLQGVFGLFLWPLKAVEIANEGQERVAIVCCIQSSQFDYDKGSRGLWDLSVKRPPEMPLSLTLLLLFQPSITHR